MLWVINQGGGLNDVYYTDYIIKNKVGYGTNTVLKDDNILVNLVKGLSKTVFKFNVYTLQYKVWY